MFILKHQMPARLGRDPHVAEMHYTQLSDVRQYVKDVATMHILRGEQSVSLELVDALPLLRIGTEEWVHVQHSQHS